MLLRHNRGWGGRMPGASRRGKAKNAAFRQEDTFTRGRKREHENVGLLRVTAMLCKHTTRIEMVTLLPGCFTD